MIQKKLICILYSILKNVAHNSIQNMHTIGMFHNNGKFIPKTCKNQQCFQELSENLRMKKMKYILLCQKLRLHTLGNNEL